MKTTEHITLNGRTYRAVTDSSGVDVFTSNGVWLGSADLAGEPLAMGHSTDNTATVCNVARTVLAPPGMFAVAYGSPGSAWALAPAVSL